MQADGLWLIGVGAFLLTVVGLAAAPLRLHLQFGGLGDRRGDRLAFSGTGLGLITTAAGSVLVAAGSSPSLGFAIATAAILVAVGWLLAELARAFALGGPPHGRSDEPPLQPGSRPARPGG